MKHLWKSEIKIQKYVWSTLNISEVVIQTSEIMYLNWFVEELISLRKIQFPILSNLHEYLGNYHISW